MQNRNQKSLDDARQYKANGNDLFSAQNWTKALQQYHLANLILKGLCGTSGENDATLGMAKKAVDGNELTETEKKEALELQVTVKLNLAACLLKVDKPQRAVDELDFVIKHDEKSVKAYYRRGTAHFALKDFEKAKKDFLKAQELSPEDKTIPNYLKKIAVWEKEQDKKTINRKRKVKSSNHQTTLVYRLLNPSCRE